jgi:hypothetical protein
MLHVSRKGGMASGMEKKIVRVPIVMSQAEVDALDEWRAVNKIWSRGDAIRRLVAEGIKGKSAPRAKG